MALQFQVKSVWIYRKPALFEIVVKVSTSKSEQTWFPLADEKKKKKGKKNPQLLGLKSVCGV